MIVNRELILDSLRELNDAQYQQEVWGGNDPERQSSFVECVEGLFDDSALDSALRQGDVFGLKVDTKLRELSALVDKTDERQTREALFSDPNFVASRLLSGQILGDLLEMGSAKKPD